MTLVYTNGTVAANGSNGTENIQENLQYNVDADGMLIYSNSSYISVVGSTVGQTQLSVVNGESYALALQAIKANMASTEYFFQNLSDAQTFIA